MRQWQRGCFVFPILKECLVVFIYDLLVPNMEGANVMWVCFDLKKESQEVYD